MTFHVHYRGQLLSCYWRADGALAVRLRPLRHHGEALLVRIGDLLTITDARGRPRWLCRGRAFVPHLQYGTFVRSGRVVCGERVAVD
jgi:hypothetical protein